MKTETRRLSTKGNEMEKEAASLKTKKNVSNPKLDSLKPKAMKWKRKDFFCF